MSHTGGKNENASICLARLPNAIIRPRRKFRSRLKALVTLVLLTSVLISSCLLVHNTHAQEITTVTLYPNTGSWEPLANSNLFSTRCGFYEYSTTYTQSVQEAAFYANGNEPVVIALAYASASRTPPNSSEQNTSTAQANVTVDNWPYLIFNKATDKPVDSSTFYSIPMQLTYRMSMSPSGMDAATEGAVAVSGRGVSAYLYEGTGPNAQFNGGSPAEGTISFIYTGEGGTLYMHIWAQTSVAASAGGYSPSEAQTVVDGYLSIDPSSPLANLLQVYVGKTANASPSDPSEWAPSVQTPVDLNKIVPSSVPTAVPTPYPSPTPTPAPSSSPTLSPSPTITQTITLNPTSGPVGSKVDFALSGFPPDDNVGVYCVSFETDVTTNPDGTATGSFTVPSILPSSIPGTYQVTAADERENSASESFMITAPSITLSPMQGPAGSTFGFSLYGFLPRDKVTVKFGTSAGGVSVNVETDVNGFSLGQLTVPSVPLGNYQVLATDSHLDVANAPFKVTDKLAPVITPNLTQGPVGSSVVLTLSGFLPYASVGLVFGPEAHPDTMHWSTKTDENGHARNSFAVPYVGAGNYYIIIATDEQGNSAATSFYVTGVPPTLTLSPTKGPVGSTANFTVSHFPPNTYFTLQFDSVPGPVDFTTDGNGYWNDSFLVPAKPPGTYIVKAMDTVPDVASEPFNIIVSTTSTASVSSNSATVNELATTGVSVTVTGSSLQNGEKVAFALKDYGNYQPPGTSPASVSGAVFYDVSVASGSGALGSDVNANVSISNPSFNSSSVAEYYNGNTWVSVASKFSAPETLSVTIPASSLSGTPIAVGIPMQRGSANPLVIDFGSISFILIVVAVAVVIICAVVLVARKMARTRSVSKSGNLVEKQSTGHD